MDTEIPATNAYAEATIIRSQEQFMFDCFQGEGKMTRTILSFPFWFCTSKLNLHILNSENFLLLFMTSGYLGMLSLVRVKYVAPPLGYLKERHDMRIDSIFVFKLIEDDHFESDMNMEIGVSKSTSNRNVSVMMADDLDKVHPHTL
ncbi:hypothetical protein V6N12_014139 [Hibiscus sabdariffa]|uniref:Uncharacterized protein n=1 Tax=Hibiscus sabdariffa TaxID=183260 RepID=A0ABR2DKE4_9ROSI